MFFYVLDYLSLAVSTLSAKRRRMNQERRERDIRGKRFLGQKRGRTDSESESGLGVWPSQINVHKMHLRSFVWTDSQLPFGKFKTLSAFDQSRKKLL